MPRYVLTGTPGSGKTAVLRQLEIDGHAIVEEAATDVIALHQALGCEEPWRDPAFIDDIVALQQRRQRSADTATFYDRSPVCTLALSRHLGRTPSSALLAEIDRIKAERIYERTVFFLRNQGFVRATAARRITLADALAFERVHEAVYRELGYDLIEVPPAPIPVRTAIIREAVESLRSPR